MEPGSTASRLTPRQRRAVGLIAFSLLAIVVASLAYLAPALHLSGTAGPNNTSAKLDSTAQSPPWTFQTMYDFASPSVGWAAIAVAGETTVFKTADGGKHWRQASRVLGNVVESIQFVDTTHGFMVTNVRHRLYRTSDGGAHWAEAVIPDDRTYRITFTDARHGSAFVLPSVRYTAQTVYTTADSGATWSRSPNLPLDGYGPTVVRGAEAWVGVYETPASRPHVYTSMDGGVSWSRVEVPRPRASYPVYNGTFYLATQVNLLPGSGVTVLASVGPVCENLSALCSRTPPDQTPFVSFDGGLTWTEVLLPPGAFFYFDIAYQDAVHWWAIGKGSLWKSSDAGQTWQETMPDVPLPAPYQLHVFDSKHAWARVYPSLAMVTNDGGLSWTRVIPPKVS
ncbi:MAG TPA: YCF48-related protein [Candidatus Eisenbacteria bacterium]|nr:YCF48-related protein [Candidatus Eisenbacteria bacterium]